jgi:hypothetical protein
VERQSIGSSLTTETSFRSGYSRFFKAESRIGRESVTFSRQASASELTDGSATEPAIRTEPAGSRYLDLDECDKLLDALATIRQKVEEKPVEKDETSVFTYDTRSGMRVAFAREGKKTLAAVNLGTRGDPRLVYLTPDGLTKLDRLIREAEDKLRAQGGKYRSVIHQATLR